MSLVGTRPPTVDEYEQYELGHRKRLAMKPGLTGMWQVSGRSDITDFDEVVACNAIRFYRNICPVFYYNEEVKHDIWGTIKGAYVGYSADPNIRYKAASGGALTEICIYLLNNKIVDGIIQTTFDPEDQTKTISVISHTANEVVERCGSRYSISVPLKNIINMMQEGKKYAFVGKPCDVMALRRYMKLKIASVTALLLSVMPTM